MHYLVLTLIFGFSAIAQAADCTPTPALRDATRLLGCEVLRRGELSGGMAWESQRRIYQAPRAGAGDMTLRMMVVKQRGEVVAWTEPGYGEPQRPEQLSSPRGMLLRLPVSPIPGTEAPLDEIWLRREPMGYWVNLNARLWRHEAEARLGAGETLAPGYNLEIRPLRATGRIGRPGDTPGRPSGGSYTAWLDLGEDRLVLIGFSRH